MPHEALACFVLRGDICTHYIEEIKEYRIHRGYIRTRTGREGHQKKPNGAPHNNIVLTLIADCDWDNELQ